ncbi:MAG TPA: hypothetical protein IAC47_05110, partial [Candidatus Onthomorpha intestinigallinarum]|nr:hypothetical protein [Candidatus Onthomorpha intestinigallinarum]
PGPVKINGFQDRRIRPLCQLSVCKGTSFFHSDKLSARFFCSFTLTFCPLERKKCYFCSKIAGLILIRNQNGKEGFA